MADKFRMENAIISLASVIFFCFCCHQLLRSVTAPIPMLRTERPYARGAMQLGKFYKVCAWGGMTVAFLGSLVISFQQVFTTF
jgi:hypothetical protein